MACPCTVTHVVEEQTWPAPIIGLVVVVSCSFFLKSLEFLDKALYFLRARTITIRPCGVQSPLNINIALATGIAENLSAGNVDR